MGIRAKILSLLFLFAAAGVSAQTVRPGAGERIFVRGGVAEGIVENKAGVNLGSMTPDSLYKYMAAVDSLRGDGIRFDRSRTDSLIAAMVDRTSPTGDTLTAEQVNELVVERMKLSLNSSTVKYFMDDDQFLARYIGNGLDTLLPKLAPVDTVGLTRRQKKQLARRDTAAYRYNKIFRDSIKLSPLIGISVAVPGFSQFYNEQYWKIPVLYGTVGAGIGMWAWQSSKYRPFRKLYDHHLARPVAKGSPGYTEYKNTMTELQNNMIKHNTNRQLALGFAVMSYMYFLIDGTLNYPGYADPVKKATTLATICPGAGQIYNKTYWKAPIVIGGFATLIYCIDFNNRGYQRYKRAYNYRTDDSEETVDEFVGTNFTASDMLRFKNNYRRNRDLCIILTGLFYVIQIIDAHATAHMKTYDISDDLAKVSLEPQMDRFYCQRAGGNVNTFGLSLNIRF